jgi:hypothetical protein
VGLILIAPETQYCYELSPITPFRLKSVLESSLPFFSLSLTFATLFGQNIKLPVSTDVENLSQNLIIFLTYLHLSILEV